VRENNVAVRVFPSSLIASLFGFGEAEFFEVEDAAVREPVRVSLS
jgi:LemA protein